MEKRFQNLMKLIKREIKKIDSLEYKDEEKANFYNDLFTKYSSKNIERLSQITTSEIFCATILLDNKDCNFGNLIEEIKEVEELINNISLDLLEEIYIISREISEQELLDMEECINLKSIIKTAYKMRKAFTYCAPTDISIDSIYKTVKLIKLFRRIKTENSLKLIVLISHLRKEEEKLNDFLENNFLNNKVKNIIKKNNRESWDYKEIGDSFEPMMNYYLTLEKEKNDLNRSKKKRKNNYLALQKLLEQESKKEEITEIDRIIEYIEDDTIYRETLEYINDHNQKYYRKLEAEYFHLSENSYASYIELFNNYEMCFQNLSQSTQELLMKIEVNELNKKIDHLSSLELPQEELINLIISSDKKLLLKIAELLEKEYLDRNFIKNHLELYTESGLLDRVIKNIDLILDLKLNLKRLTEYEFLIADTIQIKENIDLLTAYGITLVNKKLEKLNMLEETSLEEKLNSFIEVGLSELMLNDPSILNVDANLAKRVILSNTLGDELTESNKLKPYIIDKEKFYIPDDRINNYLLDRDNSDYRNERIIEITETDNNPHFIRIEGIIIPKGRIKNLKVSLEEIIKPSLYDESQIEVLESYEQKVRK